MSKYESRLQAYLHHALYSKFYNNVCEEYLATFLASVLELGKKVAVVKKKKNKKNTDNLSTKNILSVLLVDSRTLMEGGGGGLVSLCEVNKLLKTFRVELVYNARKNIRR